MKGLLGMCALATLAQGCLTTGMYRTAHVLPQGEGDFALTFSVVRASVDDYEVADETVQGLTYTYPNIIPELSYHIGIADDLEVGGRTALGAGMIEIDTKYRFVGSNASSLHLAVQPAVGYRTAFLLEGYHASLPLLLTYDLTPNIAVNTSVFGSYTHFEVPEAFDSEDGINFAGETAMGGAAIAFQFSTSSGFHIMPGVEVQRSFWRGGDLADLPSITSVVFGVTLGWGADKQMKKLEKIDEKLDKMDEKLDKIGEKVLDG
jgi:hypothetical protein